MDHHGNKRKDLDLHALQRERKPILRGQSSNATIDPPNHFSVCIFLEKQELKEKLRFVLQLN